MKLFMFVSWALVISTGAWAAPVHHSKARSKEWFKKYYTVSTVRVQTLDEETLEADFHEYDVMGDPIPAPTGDISVGEIINIGKEIWKIIEANKPVVETSTQSASALPSGITHWSQLQGWKAPKSRVYRVTYTNLFGMDVVDFAFRILFTYGGNYKGVGQYVAHSTIVPGDLSVMWGYKFNCSVEIPSVVNVGSATKPVGGIEMMLRWSVDTVMKHNESTTSFFVQGDGQMMDLSQGNLG